MPRRASMRHPARSPDEVHRLLDGAITRADLEAFLDVLDDAATVVGPLDGRTAHGRAEIRSAMAPLFELQPTLTTTVVNRLETTDLALTHHRWHLSLTEHGCRAEMTGLGTRVSRRSADGTWRVVLDDPLTSV